MSDPQNHSCMPSGCVECGQKIPSEAEQCPQCGWTWKVSGPPQAKPLGRPWKLGLKSRRFLVVLLAFLLAGGAMEIWKRSPVYRQRQFRELAGRYNLQYQPRLDDLQKKSLPLNIPAASYQIRSFLSGNLDGARLYSFYLDSVTSGASLDGGTYVALYLDEELPTVAIAAEKHPGRKKPPYDFPQNVEFSRKFLVGFYGQSRPASLISPRLMAELNSIYERYHDRLIITTNEHWLLVEVGSRLKAASVEELIFTALNIKEGFEEGLAGQPDGPRVQLVSASR